MGKKVELPEIGHHYGKPDIERIGLFVEMPYMNGKGYVSPFLSTYLIFLVIVASVNAIIITF